MIDDGAGGVLIGPDASVAWTFEAGAVHLYDFTGDAARIAGLVLQAEEIGRARFAAVLAATLLDGDPFAAALEANGFVRDWDEPDVAAGVLRTRSGYLREIA